MSVPIEAHFIPGFKSVVWLWGDLSRKKNMVQLREAIAAFIRIWIFFGTDKEGRDFLYRASLLAGLERVDLSSVDSFKALVAATYDEFNALANCQHAGYKIAPYAPESIDDFGSIFSGMKVVHIIRDGRDAILSWRALWFGPASVAEGARLWRKHIEIKRAWGRQHPDRYLELR